MMLDGLFFQRLSDPNGIEHQVDDSGCCGCVWKPVDQYCRNELADGTRCSGLNHYWMEDEDDKDSYIAYECEKCGKFQELKPIMNEELA